MQYNAIQCNAMQCNAMQCNAMQCNAMKCNEMQWNAMQCNAMKCNAMLSAYFLYIQVECKCGSLNQGDVFVLDDGPNPIWVWVGPYCEPKEQIVVGTI